jgi:predicted secreted protein
MGWLAGIFVYLILWFLSMFLVLPWGLKFPEAPEVGHANSAPIHPQLLRKALMATVLAAILWVGLDALMLSGWISFRDTSPD